MHDRLRLPRRTSRVALAGLVSGVACSFAACGGGGGGGGSAGLSTAASTSGTTATPTSTTPVTTTPAPVASTTAPGTTTPSNLPSGLLRALAYNVAGLPQGLSSSNPTANTPLISPKLNAYDLVLVEEDFWYHAQLMKDAKHPHQSPPQTGNTTFMPDGLNFFANDPFTDLTRVGWQTCNGYWNDGNDCLASKGFAVVRLEVGPGAVIDVYDLHGDASNTKADANARAAQFQQLATFMATFSKDHAVIVGGDTNLKTAKIPQDEQTYQTFLAATGLTDVARSVGFDPNRIDRFSFRSNAIVELKVALHEIPMDFVDAAGNDLSDHHPIHVDFAWRRIK